MLSTKLFLVAFTIISAVQSARILAIIPTASYSHQTFYQQLWRQLAINGHDMVVITTDPTGEQLTNFTEINIHELYEPTKKNIEYFMTESTFQIIARNRLNEISHRMTELLFNLPQIDALLRNTTEHFDLVMAEHILPVTFAFKHRFRCPFIGVISLDAFPVSHYAMGNAVHSILYPLAIMPFQEELTIGQRVAVAAFNGIMDVSVWMFRNEYNALTRKHFGDDAPDIYDLVDGTDMLFVNANPVFSAIRPHTPSTISLAGGIHMKAEKPLPEGLKAFLDSASNGAIYFSLGTNVKSNALSSELFRTFVSTLSWLPYKVLWKFDNETLPNRPENVMITKWAPQQDVLRHKNVKLFITQGGIQSLEESLYSHVPVIVIPFFGDQQANAEKVKSKGMGVVLDRFTLQPAEFNAAILEVMETPKYRERVKQLALRIQDQPQKPLERAIWWIEYVLRHKGAQHLKGPRIPSYQYYYLDIIAFCSVVLIVNLAGIYFSCKFFVRIITKCVGYRAETKIKRS